MSFTYDPSTVKEKLLKEGVFEFETVSCIEGITFETKVPKVVLTIIVFDNEGNETEIKTHITEKNVFHLKRYWDSVGHPEMFEKLSLSHDEMVYKGQKGRVKTKIEEKIIDGEKRRFLAVSSFIKRGDEVKQEEKIDFIEDEEIPF